MIFIFNIKTIGHTSGDIQDILDVREEQPYKWLVML